MRWRLLLIIAALGACAGHAPAGDLPTPPAGWKLEVVARAPAVRHPSVVCCAPDGRVFVAEDPMDIRLPSADAAAGRIVCIHPDGRVTTFAEKLHAVFGMQYLEGRLYVLHNPKFTAFVDGGDVGKEPRDLIACTNPNPWALNWNDHVPANFKLAMDGYFYVAVGDKGLCGATGTDGRRVDMRGGASSASAGRVGARGLLHGRAQHPRRRDQRRG
jgi:glucose/arabinose dehydrogenase